MSLLISSIGIVEETAVAISFNSESSSTACRSFRFSSCKYSATVSNMCPKLGAGNYYCLTCSNKALIVKNLLDISRPAVTLTVEGNKRVTDKRRFDLVCIVGGADCHGYLFST